MRALLLRRTVRLLVLGLVLAVSAVLVPDSTPRSTDVALAKVNRAAGIDLGQEVIWIAAIGSDARPGEDMTRARGDALQLVGIDPRTGAAAAIGVPRDSYVSIPGVGSDRINAALVYGGPRVMADALGSLFGIEPDYVFVTRFEFFERMVDEIGGIHVQNPRAFDDYYLKPRGFPAGRIKLDGYNALAFSRIRKSLPGGDFDRSANQQLTLRGIHERIAARAQRSGFVERGVLSVMQRTQTDVPPAELFAIAHAIAQVRPRQITTCVLRGGFGQVGEASVVLPDLGQAQRLGDRARDDATLESCS